MTEQPVQNGIEKDRDFLEVCDLFFHLQSHKAKRYGDSWCKHGEAISVFGNTSRKYDRVQNIVVDYAERGVPLPPPDSDESLAETVGDLGIYSILWMTYIKKNRPQEYRSWKAKIEGLPEGRCSLHTPLDAENAGLIQTGFAQFMREMCGVTDLSEDQVRAFLKATLSRNVI